MLFDIRKFYYFIKRNDQIIDKWCFENVVTIKYWNYLYNYNWLNNEEREQLQQGIMSMLLFLCFLYLNNTSFIIINHLAKIKKAINAFKPSCKKSIILHHELTNALKMAEEKKEGSFNFDNNKEIYKSISWTLDKIILTDKNIHRKTASTSI